MKVNLTCPHCQKAIEADVASGKTAEIREYTRKHPGESVNSIVAHFMQKGYNVHTILTQVRAAR